MNTQVYMNETAHRYAWFRNKIREPDPSIKANPRIRDPNPVDMIQSASCESIL